MRIFNIYTHIYKGDNPQYISGVMSFYCELYFPTLNMFNSASEMLVFMV